MRISLRRSFRAFICILAGLILTQKGLAQDDTNAMKIPGTGAIWANMNQVMGGNSATLPGSSTIRGPAGIYANVQLNTAINNAFGVVCPSTPNRIRICPNESQNVDAALTTYFLYVLNNPAVSGLLVQAQWQDLQPLDPGPNPSAPANSDSTAFDYLDAAFKAITTWNNDNPSAAPKTLQLTVSPGFNSPKWLFNEIDTAAGGLGKGSCDGLFMTPAPSTNALSGCGYTTIFYRTESRPQSQLPLPLPWNPTYKAYWQAFLSALSHHIGSNPSFVSIGVAGPTASSDEIILPNGDQKAKTNKNADTLTVNATYVPDGYTAFGVSVYTAWNCLLGNSYGISGNCLAGGFSTTADSNYINSDRAFIEEWAAAIDMYGAIFSGVTLVVSTGAGLPNFCVGVDSGSSSCPTSSSPLLYPPPAFVPDCLDPSEPGSPATMDCAAETAILAYLAGPPVGGANAKATQEDGLKATGIHDTPLSGASVKWLSDWSASPLSVLNPGSGNWAVGSHMLGGLQLAKKFSDAHRPSSGGPSDMQYEGCLKDTTCTITPEQALLNVLTAYFQGTLVAARLGTGPAMNGTATVAGAPINYLQIWDADILYARGYQPCSTSQLMTPPKKPGGPPPECKTEDMKTHTVYAPLPLPDVPAGGNLTAQELLNVASYEILNVTKERVTNPPICGCSTPGYVLRDAFQGDAVCVDPTHKTQAETDNNNANAKQCIKPGNTCTYANDYTDYSFMPQPVPYGNCINSSYKYRRAYMGDYVCVQSSTAMQVANDNLAGNPVQFCSAPP